METRNLKRVTRLLMPNIPDCQTIDPLVTPFVDRQLSDADCRAVDEHLSVCPQCRTRVIAERAVRDLCQARRAALSRTCAPGGLYARCAQYARSRPLVTDAAAHGRSVSSRFRPFARHAVPLALAASLAILVGGAFLYQLTESSSRVMAAELTADHLKCLALNGVLHTNDTAAAVESSMLSGFGWRMQLLSDRASGGGLDLVGARPCLYGEGKIAHIMYRYHGEPVSLFMLPRTRRAQEVVQALGHQAAIWCVNNRTFVLVAREPRREIDRIATIVQASLKP
jgi:anti-sigma factor RsiW